MPEIPRVKVLTAAQLKEADAYTIEHEPVAAIDLMERAAQQCAGWISKHFSTQQPVSVFCGNGGNGGDGLAIARLLSEAQFYVSVYILESGKLGTPEFQTNLERLHATLVAVNYIQSEDHFPPIDKASLVVDALFGFGLSRPLEGMSAALVNHLNDSGAAIISIDLPSGLFADRSSAGNVVIKAQHTLSFQCYKLALLVADNAAFIGDVQILPIGLHKDFIARVNTPFQTIDAAMVKQTFRPRQRFAHKGTFGHTLLVGGSYGKIGALVLAASAGLQSGTGLVTTYAPKCGYSILQTAIPEAMALSDSDEIKLTNAELDTAPFSAMGIGPGMGTAPETEIFLYELLKKFQKPVVIDADALNLLAKAPEQLKQLFKNTILTPHPKEFERLFGTCRTDLERIDRALENAAAYNIIIVLKGHHTFIALPDGSGYFNTTGNAGMAKGGSGDSLTGIIASLLAQRYPPRDAALLGVYLHGRAGDYASAEKGEEACTPRDLIAHISSAFREIKSY